MGEKKLNVFFIPHFASGHMLPMADLAALFARHPNVIPTMCVTPANAALLEPTLDPNVKVLAYPFPSEAAGLPSGMENVSSIDTPEQEQKIYTAVGLCQADLTKLLHEHHPDAIVSDFGFWWTSDVAREMGIPRLVWQAAGAFPNLAMNSLNEHVHEIVAAGKEDNGIVQVKGMPGKKEIRMPVSELPQFVRKQDPVMNGFWSYQKTIQLESYGAIVNTVHGIEPEYCDRYRETQCKRAWFVGPVALARGRAEKEKQQHECMRWLDTKEEGSVVYVCLGSWCQMEEDQLREMAVGLERSRKSFLWVVRKGWTMPGEEEWEERVQGRGMVVRGWVPQAAVLEHRAVGAFLTHCGWNSVMEAMAAGVPMLTWPLVWDQFVNERMMAEVVEVGTRVFDGYRSTRNEEKVIVPASAVAKAVSEFMAEEGKEGRRRRKATECKEIAKAAVAEGGSSWNDLNCLIDGLKELCL